MGLQKKDLVMVGLGICDDQPPNRIQPKLVNGIHLRWAFKQEHGFPPYGFYLFRRRSEMDDKPICFRTILQNYEKGWWNSNTIRTPFGDLTSDNNILFTDVFPMSNLLELDLKQRQYLRFTLHPDFHSYQVRMKIGFYGEQSKKHNVHFKKTGSGPNPLVYQDVKFDVRDHRGFRVRNTNIVKRGTYTGLNCGLKVIISLPVPTSKVELLLTSYAKPAELKAITKGGKCEDSQMMKNTVKPQLVTLKGNGITQIVIYARENKTLLHGLRFKGSDLEGSNSKASVQITILSENTPVERVSVTGNSGQVVEKSFMGDWITGVELSGGSAALVDLCFTPVKTQAARRWEQVPGFPYPMTLPVIEKNYPCTWGREENLLKARELAKKRIYYGKPEDYVSISQPEYTKGTVSCFQDLPLVRGVNTFWTDQLVGAVFQVDGDPTGYTIIDVKSRNELILSRNYTGQNRRGAKYTIREDSFGQLHDYLVHLVKAGQEPMAQRTFPAPAYSAGTVSVTKGSSIVTGINTDWGDHLLGLDFRVQINGNEERSYIIRKINSPTSLTLNCPYGEDSRRDISYGIYSRFGSETGDSPRMPFQNPLQLTLLSSVHPAFAQMLGLYWVDQKVGLNVPYDYLILADYTGAAHLNPDKALDVIRQSGFKELEGFIVFYKKMAPAQPLAAPRNLHGYALPGGTVDKPDAVGSVGLTWEMHLDQAYGLPPDVPVMYHLWRALQGDGDEPKESVDFELLTSDSPIPVSWVKDISEEQSRVIGWPPFGMNYIDGKLPEGWYGYQVSGIDIFGRHSKNSEPALWYQWAPVPEPKPWYYQTPESHSPVKISGFPRRAVRLLDKTPPPPPTGIEAYALDPLDPTLVKDEAYLRWWESVSTSQWYLDLSHEEKAKVTGIRVRWLWTFNHMKQAPDTKEFRVYFHPGLQNTELGRTTNVVVINNREVSVATDISPARSPVQYIGANLRIGQNNFMIVGASGDPLVLRVTVDETYSEGRVSVTRGIRKALGSNTNWTRGLAGKKFQIIGEEKEYTILNIDSHTELTLAEVIESPTVTGKNYLIKGRFPLKDRPCAIVFPHNHRHSIDYTLSKNWAKRAAVVNYEDNVLKTITPWSTPEGDLRGIGATVDGTTVNLNNQVNLANLPLDEVRLWLGRDLNHPEKLYRIVSIDNVQKRVTINGENGIPGIDGSNSPWVIGKPEPLYQYEIFLLPPGIEEVSAGEEVPQWDFFTPTLAEPIVHAQIGVSAADDKTHTHDPEPGSEGAPLWADGMLGKRTGNEGFIGAPSRIFKVLRIPPDPPEPFEDSECVYATRADYHGHSYYTYRWRKADYLKTHIFRAMDNTLFKTDWLIRETRSSLDPSKKSHRVFFPKDWSLDRQERAAEQLNGISSVSDYLGLSEDARTVLALLPGNGLGLTDAELKNRDWLIRSSRQMPSIDGEEMTAVVNELSGIDSFDKYAQLSNKALQTLAGLPGNEDAFVQLTIEPLDPSTQDACVYRDTLDGLSTNRYFYRAAYVDGAHNRSKLSSSSPPVYLPDVVPPRKPVITKVLLNDGEATLKWASNREIDLREYRVYRTASREHSRSLRLMTLVHTEPVEERNPLDRPSEISWTDTGLIGGNHYFYRLVAVDEKGNLSVPSEQVEILAVDLRVPEPPEWLNVSWVLKDEDTGTYQDWPVNGVVAEGLIPTLCLVWTSPLQQAVFSISKKRRNDRMWKPVASKGDYKEIAPQEYLLYDADVSPEENYIYRIQVTSSSGVMSAEYRELSVARP